MNIKEQERILQAFKILTGTKYQGSDEVVVDSFGYEDFKSHFAIYNGKRYNIVIQDIEKDPASTESEKVKL
ncbi:hypothetical protein [Aerococcus sp. 1KP-2016]|uniref:hypothetical protein n=1 Tax=Aerococcus sp. 1KP-2016 TaxID=1981982 RepID=UPI000B995EDA|nr:hypothetical protein [Aerococcus sp. 1KP-2016]OYQ68295.1 hypothetical protein B9P78_00360 [Aerococcus sp. 1KP-2016]